MKLIRVLVSAVAVLYAMNTMAYEVGGGGRKPPGYGERTLYLSTEDRPSYGDTSIAEDALTQAIDEIMKYSSWHSADLTYTGTRDTCVEGEEKVTAVCWMGMAFVYDPMRHVSAHGMLVGGGVPAVFMEQKSTIKLNLYSRHLPGLFDDPEALCVAFLQTLLSSLGLGKEYDVPSITNDDVNHRSCELYDDDIEGLAFVHPPSGETNFHCGWTTNGEKLTIPLIGYNGKWFRATTEWERGTGWRKVTSAERRDVPPYNALPYPGCEELLTFDEDLTVYSVPVFYNPARPAYQGAVYEITFTLDVADMSIEVISQDLISDNGFGVGVEDPNGD